MSAPTDASDSETEAIALRSLEEQPVIAAQRSLMRRHGKSVLSFMALALAVLAVVPATLFTLRMALRHGDAQPERNVESFAEMAVKPAYEKCAKKPTDDCLLPKCCAVSGMKCYKTAAVAGKCMKSCTPGGMNGTCEEVAPPTKPVVGEPGMSLFCFAVYTFNTGSSKVSHELELLRMQKARSASLFSCADWSVYSDVSVPLDSHFGTTQVKDVKNDFHLFKRKTTGAWVNTGMFVQVWSAIKAEGRFKHHNWVVKVDADAVFFPARLIKALGHATVPKEGVYMENCKYVDWGFFGSLEVYSKDAFDTLVTNLEYCYNTVPWKVGVHGGKYGPMGEDLFAQQCMDKMGVAKLEAFELTTDGACEADRPREQKNNKKFMPDCSGVTTPGIHPFKKPEMYFKCMNEAASITV